KLLCDVETGDVYYAIYDRDVFQFSHTTNIPLVEFEISEIIPDNVLTCIDLKRNEHAVSIDRRRKYQVIDGYLESLDGWERLTV
ncbi:MAG: hypothetical protein KAJ03_12060, partial [Gammaproteobacteria bacterium]|nr:hypothetical protein [Gammaproteobacteria bacterium]